MKCIKIKINKIRILFYLFSWALGLDCVKLLKHKMNEEYLAFFRLTKKINIKFLHFLEGKADMPRYKVGVNMRDIRVPSMDLSALFPVRMKPISFFYIRHPDI